MLMADFQLLFSNFQTCFSRAIWIHDPSSISFRVMWDDHINLIRSYYSGNMFGSQVVETCGWHFMAMPHRFNPR